ncbi:hypothetical protein [Yimella sp. cx-51]|uniref:hypothetical protein n=1 Tax=Yimella sp. cx-51 TaxID=2770551 RepID=UPI00165D93D2|nr:hypothetical protein [Yimella sp. cx-51]MBC9956219.1 hypothetical protein [Yimella sp. cx-51]QTH38635.1 hypothetical protein J5M86_02960 [Yimella sp. cx-51]
MKPQLNRRKGDPLLDHARARVDRVYGTLAVIAYLLRHDDRHGLVGQLRHTLEQFASIRTQSPDMMMLPEDWQDLELWSRPVAIRESQASAEPLSGVNRRPKSTIRRSNYSLGMRQRLDKLLVPPA